MPNSNHYGFIIRPCHRYLQDVLSLEQLGRLWISIMEYVEKGSAESIKFESDIEKLAFLGIKSQIDKDKEQYAKKCEINRKNGKKGGRPTKNDEPF